MRKIWYFGLIAVLFFVGCKYEEGPSVSFVKARYRVTGNYKLDKFYVNDIDTTKYYNSLICNSGFSFSIEGNNHECYIRPFMPTYITQCPYNFVGQWELNESNNLLTIGPNANIPILGPWGQPLQFDWNIIKLTDDEMHIGGKSFETTYRLEFKKI